MKTKWILRMAVVTGLVAAGGCQKDEEAALPASSLDLQVTYKVDADALLFDTLMYANAAGNSYSVSKIEYYLSQIGLIRPDSSVVLLDYYHYFNAAEAATNSISYPVAEGDYIGICFNIGLDSAQNITGALPNTVENTNMEWPVPMGGGYHFMKFEGHFESGGSLFGFAMHLGRNENLVKVKIFSTFSFSHQQRNCTLAMNLNEWFCNPETYDLNIDGNYSMGNMAAMHKLSMNGSDVFTRVD